MTAPKNRAQRRHPHVANPTQATVQLPPASIQRIQAAKALLDQAQETLSSLVVTVAEATGAPGRLTDVNLDTGIMTFELGPALAEVTDVEPDPAEMVVT